MNATKEQILPSQAAYSRVTLPFYDFLVIGISHRYIWQCPAGRLEDLYNGHVSANHLDLGVGTGYLLDRCHFPSEKPRIALMDLNPGPLAFASRRIQRYKPEVYARNVLEPISINAPGFDSVGINDVLHCLPGSIESKALAFDHLKALMNPGAVIFGSTVLREGVQPTWLASKLMDIYNKMGMFSNRRDSLDDLQRALNRRFQSVLLEVVGCVALFAGHI
jgi:2-polyprenyl-3-methyl-5-hydroxy-6-metoxy-1,4-benzoquinol methylase